MLPNKRFTARSKRFWANIRIISQEVGYTQRGNKQIKVPSINEIINSLKNIGLKWDHIIDRNDKLTELGKDVIGYFQYRAKILNEFVEPRLMDVDKARRLFEELHGRYEPKCPLPLNKQKGEKKSPAFLTCLINMIIEANSKGYPCAFEPYELTTVTENGYPVRTLARRIDGAFPGPVNPIAVWEVKEYYYTTTFGSRVADGIYETLLDGMELEDLKEKENIDVKHYLMVDSHYTWWECGRSYLCRIVDMLHMGYIDEALFGYEVIERLPLIVNEWVESYHKRRIQK